jgi:hypothetical protein
MAVPELITIPLRLARGEAMALARLCQCIHVETCVDFASAFAAYGGRAEGDVIWSAVTSLRTALAKAGFAPR